MTADPAIQRERWEITAIVMEVEPRHVHTGPWQLQPGSPVLSSPWEREWADTRSRAKGEFQPSVSSWRGDFCGTFQAGRAGEMRAG